MDTINDEKFKRIFRNELKINPYTTSIKTLLSDRNLRRINFAPYYQRNYVWDVAKQSFFIESVLLGTEIPPMIMFKHGSKMEVIDGRQRFETLKLFKENDIMLSANGLMELTALDKQRFNTLGESLQEKFLDSNIRIFEVSIISDVDADTEDRVKKEIFRRYNTGITPLTSVEIDSAKYDDDEFSNALKKMINDDASFKVALQECFRPSIAIENKDLPNKLADFLRKAYIMPDYPINSYARGNKRDLIQELLYENKTQSLESIEEEIKNYITDVKQVLFIYKELSIDDDFKKNRLLYECMLWAIRIAHSDGKRIYVDDELIARFRELYKKNLADFSDDNSFYYGSIVRRYKRTAEIFHEVTGVNFENYLSDSDFKDSVKQKQQKDEDVEGVVQKLASLRVNKPNPLSKPVEEIISDVATNKYLLRPSYQRQERITEIKASSIIESILLGIALPPIFIYKKKNNVREVVDGQQRLLSIIAFMGKQYCDENNKLVYSKNNNFKLKKLNILDSLNGCKFSDLSEDEQDKILDFNIDEIVIEEALNEDFDPIDLFIRLNQKPYPIQQNSFEMWNSTVDGEVIQKIKKITDNNIEWFYIKERTEESGRADRMENEELMTLLTYIDAKLESEDYSKILGSFQRLDRLTLRIYDKSSVTRYLEGLGKNLTEKESFLHHVDETDRKIKLLGEILSDNINKEQLNGFFNVKHGATFRRSNQDFYISWIVLHYACKASYEDKESIREDILRLLKLLRNADNVDIDETYYENFTKELKACIQKYQRE